MLVELVVPVVVTVSAELGELELEEVVPAVLEVALLTVMSTRPPSKGSGRR